MKEAFRLAELYSLDILDTPKEPEFDALVQIASDFLDCPFGTLTLVDSDRQWFKARVGVSVCETPRDILICQHVVKANRPLIINNLLFDDRVSNSPLVTFAPHLRAYLGVPILSINKAIMGTLCVFDSVPRKWTERDVRLMTRLTKIAEQLLQKYHTAKPTNALQPFNNPDLNTTSEICGVWWGNVSSVKVTVSAGLRSILGLPPKLSIGKIWFSNFGIKRKALVENSNKKHDGKNIINYDFLHPEGSLLKIEETIYYSDFNEILEYCGVVRLIKDHVNKLQTPHTNSTLLRNTLPAKSINAVEWLASLKTTLVTTHFYRVVAKWGS